MEIEGPNYYIENGYGYFGMLALPDEIQAQIFKRLRKDVLRSLRLTCKTVKVSYYRLFPRKTDSLQRMPLTVWEQL